MMPRKKPVIPEAGVTDPTIPMATMAKSSDGEKAKPLRINLKIGFTTATSRMKPEQERELKIIQVEPTRARDRHRVGHPEVDQDHDREAKGDGAKRHAALRNLTNIRF